MEPLPKFLVLIGDSEVALRESIEIMLTRYFCGRYDLEIDHRRYGEDIVAMAERRKYNLFVLFINNIPFRHPLPDALTRIAHAVDLVSPLKSTYLVAYDVTREV